MYSPALPIGIFLIADAATQPLSGEWWGPLIQLGVAGVMLIWFMLRVEKHMGRQTESNQRLAKAIERATKAHMVTVASLKSIERLGLKDLARGIVDEIDSREESDHENTDS